MSARDDMVRVRCLFCGGPQVHRLREAIRDRFLAGEAIPTIAANYGRSEADVEQVIRDAVQRPRRKRP